MPTLPKWLANSIERVFDRLMHPVQVQQIQQLAPQLKRVRFVGDFSAIRYQPGQVIEFRVDDTSFRHYTPASLHNKEGWCDVLFYLHGKGPGSHWADQLVPGASTKLMGPGGNMRFQQATKYHFVFGDASALGLAYALQEAAEAAGHEFLCLLELTEEQQDWHHRIGLEADVVRPDAHQAAWPAIQDLQSWPMALWRTWQHAQFYLAGQKASIRAFKQALQQQGIPSKQITSLSYWAKGKKGL